MYKSIAHKKVLPHGTKNLGLQAWLDPEVWKQCQWSFTSLSSHWMRIFYLARKWKWTHSVVSDSLWPCGLQTTRLLCPWDSPGKNTGVGCHFLFQGIFPTQRSNPGLLHCRQMLYHPSHQGRLNVQLGNMLEQIPKSRYPGFQGMACDAFRWWMIREVSFHGRV